MSDFDLLDGPEDGRTAIGAVPPPLQPYLAKTSLSDESGIGGPLPSLQPRQGSLIRPGRPIIYLVDCNLAITTASEELAVPYKVGKIRHVVDASSPSDGLNEDMKVVQQGLSGHVEVGMRNEAGILQG